MFSYIIQRLLIMIPTLLAISIIVFTIIQLPPGDYFTTWIDELQSQGESVDLKKIAFLKAEYGFDQPVWQQYLYWVGGLLHGDMGYSFDYNLPVSDVVGDRLLLTFIVSFATVVFTYIVAFPIGIYSATHQYSWSDHTLTLLGFLGLATPNFLLALVMLYLANIYFGISIGGLMDPHYLDKPWSWEKIVSVLQHLWIPVIVIGLSGTAGMIRRLRANLLDELQKQYVDDGAREGRAAVQGADEISAAHGAQPVHLGHRHAAAAHHLRRRRRLGGAEPADHRPDAARGAAQPGHVSRRILPHVPRCADRHRRLHLRPRARRARSAHPPLRRGDAMSEATHAADMAAPERLPHYVSPEPFDPLSVEEMTTQQERYYMASQWRMMWWKLKRHRIAVISGVDPRW